LIAELPAQPVDAVELPADVPRIARRHEEEEEDEGLDGIGELQGRGKEGEAEKWWVQLKQGRDSFA